MEAQLKVALIAHTPQPERVVAAAAKLCYSGAAIEDLLDGLDEGKSREFVEMLAGLGHASPTEHAVFTFAVEGVSRALLAQLTRHRIASFSVQSQRYVQLDDFDFVLPPEVGADDETRTLFNEAMAEEAAIYKRLTAKLAAKHQARLLAEGKTEAQARRAAQKQAIEDARFVLPNACTTKLIMTMNARSLRHFFALRCCNRAQWEIRALAGEMLRLVLPVAPALFYGAGPACVSGPCSEGSMTCGQMAEVRERYTALHAAAKGEAAHG